MACFEHGTIIDLAARESVPLPDLRGTTLRVTRGSVWITQENDTQDVVLRAGDNWVIERNGLTLMEAQLDATVCVLGRHVDTQRVAAGRRGARLARAVAGAARLRDRAVHGADAARGALRLTGDAMPLVTVTLQAGRSAAFKDAVLRGVHGALVAAGVPEADRFQRVLELPAEDFRFDPGYPDAASPRGEDFVLVEILWSVGRSVKVKRKAAGAIVRGAARRPGRGSRARDDRVQGNAMGELGVRGRAPAARLTGGAQRAHRQRAPPMRAKVLSRRTKRW